MKLLVFGAGIMGLTYAWQLSEAGHDVSILVRKEKKELFEKTGITINCWDFRDGKKQIRTVFRPSVIDELLPENEFQLIIVSVSSYQVDSVLPVLAKNSGKADILFFQNNWNGTKEIEKYLSDEQYLFGFPQIGGGGGINGKIDITLSGDPFATTVLGEKNGKATPRVKRIAHALAEANLKPKISGQILPWLMSHYAWITALEWGVVRAGGSINTLVNNNELLRETVLAIREGFSVCQARGVKPGKYIPNFLFYLPLFLIYPILKHIFGKEEMSLIFDVHLRQKPYEIVAMYETIIGEAQARKLTTPTLDSLKGVVEEYTL